MRNLILGCILFLFQGLNSGHAQTSQSNFDQFVEDQDRIVVLDYFGQLGAFATFINRGQRSADSYKLPEFYLMPRREDCFPGYQGSTPHAQPIKEVKEERILDLQGKLDATVSAVAQGEIKGNVQLIQGVKSLIKVVMMEAPDYQKITQLYSETACPQLSQYMRHGRANGSHIIIGDVFYAGGEFEITYRLKILGSLQIESKNALSKILTTFGFKGFSLDIAGSGAYQVLKHSSFKMSENIPIAFRPLYLDDRDLSNFIQQYLKKGIYKKIASNRDDERTLKLLLTEFGIKELGSRPVFASLSTGEKLVPFDRSNTDHLAYVDFKTLIMAAGPN